jgi:hypothetical protein
MSNNKKGFLPTKNSLQISRIIAKSLNIEFNEKEVSNLSKKLQTVYYEEISKILNLPNIEFNHGAKRKINAYVEMNSNESQSIFFDDQLEFWLFDMCFINSLASFKEVLKKDLHKILINTLNTFRNPSIFEDQREFSLSMIAENLDIINFSHDLNKAISIFIICHEIAHVTYQHLKDDKTAHKREFEADFLGYQFFIKVIKNSNKSEYIQLQKMFICAPIIFFNCLALEETYMKEIKGLNSSRSTHPDPFDRSAKLFSLFKKHSEEHDLYVLDVLLKGVANLQELILWGKSN